MIKALVVVDVEAGLFSCVERAAGAKFPAGTLEASPILPISADSKVREAEFVEELGGEAHLSRADGGGDQRPKTRIALTF